MYPMMTLLPKMTLLATVHHVGWYKGVGVGGAPLLAELCKKKIANSILMKQKVVTCNTWCLFIMAIQVNFFRIERL